MNWHLINAINDWCYIHVLFGWSQSLEVVLLAFVCSCCLKSATWSMFCMLSFRAFKQHIDGCFRYLRDEEEKRKYACCHRPNVYFGLPCFGAIWHQFINSRPHIFSENCFLVVDDTTWTHHESHLSLASVCVKRGGGTVSDIVFVWEMSCFFVTEQTSSVQRLRQEADPVQMAQLWLSENKPLHFQKEALEAYSVRMCKSHTEDCSGKINMCKCLDVVVDVQTSSSTIFKIRTGRR